MSHRAVDDDDSDRAASPPHPKFHPDDACVLPPPSPMPLPRRRFLTSPSSSSVAGGHITDDAEPLSPRTFLAQCTSPVSTIGHSLLYQSSSSSLLSSTGSCSTGSLFDSRSSLESRSSRRCSMCSTVSSSSFASHTMSASSSTASLAHLSHSRQESLVRAASCEESALLGTPDGFVRTIADPRTDRNDTEPQAQEESPQPHIDQERIRAEITASVYNSLRNPCHQLLACIDLLDGSPALAGLVEERDMMRTIRTAASSLRAIIANDTSGGGGSTQVTPTSGPVRSSGGSFTSPVVMHLKSASANNSPQQAQRAQTATPSGSRSLPRSISALSSNPPPDALSRVSRTPPLPMASLTSRPSGGTTSSRFDLTSLHVLMVDDMNLNRKVLRKMLEGVHQVDVACDGLEAVHAVRNKLEMTMRIKLPPIPNLDAMMLENKRAHPLLVTESSPIATPLQTPSGTPTSATTPTTPMMLASPEATSPSHTTATTVALPSRPASFELPVSEERVERHLSFPNPNLISTSSVSLTQQSWSQTPPSQMQASGAGGGQQTPSIGGGDLSAAMSPPGPASSPLSPPTPLVMPATPNVILSPSGSRRHTLPMPMPKSATLPAAIPTAPSARCQYDVIITDLTMPSLSGLQEVHLIRQLEAEFNLPPVPIIAVTSNTTQADRESCARGQFDYFLAKPFSRRDVLGILELIVHERSQQQHSLKHLRRNMAQASSSTTTTGLGPAATTMTQTQQTNMTSAHGDHTRAATADCDTLPRFSMLPAAAIPPSHRERQISITSESPEAGAVLPSSTRASTTPSRRFTLPRTADVASSTSSPPVPSAFFHIQPRE